MLRFIRTIKLDKIKEGDGGGTPPAATKPEDKPTPTPNPAPVEEAGDSQFDDYGYPITPESKGDQKEAGKGDDKPEPSKEPEKVENPSTGYGDVEPEVPAEEVTPEPPKKEEPIQLPYELKVEGLPKEDVELIKEFAEKHKDPKDLLQAYADLRKQQLVDAEALKVKAEKEQQRRVAQQRAEWHKELKSDPAFGGEKFGHNVLQAEKVMQEFMPNTKKRLTETKAMLPPYVMRDLAKLAEHLYATDRLVQGEAPAPSEAKDQDDPLAFYG